VEEALATEVLMASAPGRPNPLDMFCAGCSARLQVAASDSPVRRTRLQDARSVVGCDVWRDIYSRH
jgi:hypothetical protein